MSLPEELRGRRRQSPAYHVQQRALEHRDREHETAWQRGIDAATLQNNASHIFSPSISRIISRPLHRGAADSLQDNAVLPNPPSSSSESN